MIKVRMIRVNMRMGTEDMHEIQELTYQLSGDFDDSSDKEIR